MAAREAMFLLGSFAPKTINQTIIFIIFIKTFLPLTFVFLTRVEVTKNLGVSFCFGFTSIVQYVKFLNISVSFSSWLKKPSVSLLALRHWRLITFVCMSFMTKFCFSSHILDFEPQFLILDAESRVKDVHVYYLTKNIVHNFSFVWKSWIQIHFPREEKKCVLNRKKTNWSKLNYKKILEKVWSEVSNSTFKVREKIATKKHVSSKNQFVNPNKSQKKYLL